MKFRRILATALAILATASCMSHAAFAKSGVCSDTSAQEIHAESITEPYAERVEKKTGKVFPAISNSNKAAQTTESKVKEEISTVEETHVNAANGSSFNFGNGTSHDVTTHYPADYKPGVGLLAENEQHIFDFLKEKLEFNDAQALGVLCNIFCESSFNPNAEGAGGDYGLVQWVGSRYEDFIYWCNWQVLYPSDIDAQLTYIYLELTNSHYYVYEKLLTCDNTEEGLKKSAYYFCKYFEVPYETEKQSEYRANLAVKMYGNGF